MLNTRLTKDEIVRQILLQVEPDARTLRPGFAETQKLLMMRSVLEIKAGFARMLEGNSGNPATFLDDCAEVWADAQSLLIPVLPEDVNLATDWAKYFYKEWNPMFTLWQSETRLSWVKVLPHFTG